VVEVGHGEGEMKLELPLQRWDGILNTPNKDGSVVSRADVSWLESAYAALLKRCEAAEAAIEEVEATVRCRWCGVKWEEQELQPHMDDCSYKTFESAKAAHEDIVR
jgi:hypothetical protein